MKNFIRLCFMLQKMTGANPTYMFQDKRMSRISLANCAELTYLKHTSNKCAHILVRLINTHHGADFSQT